MKGADQCPRCGSRHWAEDEQPVTPFYARTLRVCGNPACLTTGKPTAWEPFSEADLLDEGQRYSSFKEPCNNCAFRPGSPEQKDPARWKELMATLSVGANGWPAGEFFCHKGVPLDIAHETESDSGFAYPYKDGKADRKHLRPCRGYLSMRFAQLQKLWAAEDAEHEAAGLGHA